MPTCNFEKNVHNLWLQQLGKRSIHLYNVTSYDYIYAFKQSTLYKQYLQGGQPSHGLDRNELLLRRAQRSNDLVTLVATMANYISKSSFTNHLPHLKGEEVFGSTKQLAICPLSADNDSHRPNHVNFFRPRVIILAANSILWTM